MLTQEQIIKKYGNPGDPDKLTTIILPFPMRLAWDKTKVVKKIQCHELIAKDLLNALTEILAHYGFAEIQKLGIDIFGGCVNVRLMRGSKTKMSTHSWGIALDFDPDNNQLKWTSKKARFAKPEYKKMFEIFYKYGFESLGIEEDRDWMHIQKSS